MTPLRGSPGTDGQNLSTELGGLIERPEAAARNKASRQARVQLGALGLVLNAVVLWNTVYLDAALARPQGQGYPVRDDDVARLSSLGHAHLNVLGRYTFTTATPGAGLRPLRDPDSAAGGAV